MINFGQFYGWHNTLCVQLRRISSYNINEKVFSFYKKIFSILQNDIIKFGSFSLLDSQKEKENNILSWKWTYNDKTIIIIGNFQHEENQFILPFSEIAPISADNCQTIVIKELIEGKEDIYEIKSLQTNGLQLILPGYSLKLYYYY